MVAKSSGKDMLETSQQAPIDALRHEVLNSLNRKGRVVVTAPTGSGKSTRVPLWCSRGGARVLVVEPRRLACRSLARYVATLTGTTVGKEVGYAVRHDASFGPNSQVVFATPGTVLSMIRHKDTDPASGDLLRKWDVLVIDEFHERQIELDLLLAFALEAPESQLVVMSATIDVHRLASFIDAEVLEGHGRMFPVDVLHTEGPSLPSPNDLDSRVVDGVGRALDFEGDILVFLPGKSEIETAGHALRALCAERNIEVVPLHGDLPPKDQDRPFHPGAKRRVILATNVAETSVTLPRIGVVIDSGLVRQTRYHAGRGILKLVPIAADSSEQRRGRAGRLGPGRCLRLWSKAAKLEGRTPPEIVREDLTNTGLLVAACGFDFKSLSFLDPPPPYSIDAARDALVRVRCLDPSGEITALGIEVSRLPVDARQGCFLVAARRATESGQAPERLLLDAIEMVAALGVGRRLLQPISGVPPETRLAWRSRGCDTTELVLALRGGKAGRDFLHPYALAEGRRITQQLRSLLGLKKTVQGGGTVDNGWLARLWIRADPHTAFLRRKRGHAFGRSGAEVQLPRSSLISEKVDAIVVPELFALNIKHRLVKLSVGAIPTTVSLFRECGLGKDVVANVKVRKNVLRCEVNRVFSGRVLEKREEIPSGDTCTAALKRCLLEGRLFRDAVKESRERIRCWNLYRDLKRLREPPPGDLEAWLSVTIEALGVESGRDLALLMAADFLWPWPAPLNEEERRWLTRGFPSSLNLGSTSYDIEYNAKRRCLTLHQTKGKRREAPGLTYLPNWSGWTIQWKKGNALSVLRR